MTKRKASSSSLNTIQRFELFTKRVRELNDLRLVKSGMQWNFKIRWEAKSGLIRYEPAEIDIDDLRSFLLLFRQFISPSEPIFISRIFNDCYRFLIDKKLKVEVKKAKTDWNKQYSSRPSMSFIFNDNKVTPEHVLDLWINGHYFHNDADKMAQLEQLLKCPIPIAQVQLINTLPILTSIINFLGQVIMYGLENDLFHIPEEST